VRIRQPKTFCIVNSENDILNKCTGQNAVDLRLSILKPLDAAWINSMHAKNPSLVINGFKEAGILESIQNYEI